MNKPRIRKAWHVWPTWSDAGRRDIVYAPTASKARYSLFLSLNDSTRITDILARRAKNLDVILPPRDPICNTLPAQAISAMQHCYGISSHNPYKAGYRNYYCTRPDDAAMAELKKLGLAEIFSSMPNSGNVMFQLTERGIQVALSTDHEYAPWPKTKAADPKAGG